MKREDLALVAPEQFRDFGPCWLRTEEWCARCERVAAMRAEWNALDVLDLEDVGGYDKLWSVLREAFLPPMLLHEFACRCAEWALSLVNAPDPRSVEAIRVKRRWMAGEATDDERSAAWAAAWGAARSAAWAAAWAAMRSAAWAATRSEAWGAAWLAATDARWAASFATPDDEAQEHEIDILRNLINEWEE